MHIFASRQCADYACASYVGADEVHMARVTFAVGEAVWYLPQWSRRAVVPDLYLHRQRMPSSIINYICPSRAYNNVRLCDTHMPWEHIWPWVGCM